MSGLYALIADGLLRLMSAGALFCLFPGWKKKLGASLAYGGMLLLLQKLLVGRWNFLYFIRETLCKDLTYQDLAFFGVTICACLLAGLLGGSLLRDQKGFARPRRGLGMLLVSLVILASSLGWYMGVRGTDQIRLNEICPGNGTAYLDETDFFPDYVELINTGFLSNRTEGLYLSDREDEPGKLAVAERILKPGETYAVPLVDDSFSLRLSGGETVILSDDSGRVLDKVTTVPMEFNQAYVRKPDAFGSWQVLTCSPGENNEASFTRLEAPSFSHQSGFYKEGFDLTISGSGTIYYTLDGSEPDENSFLYQGPVTVYDPSAEPNRYRNVQNVTYDWENNHFGEEPVRKALVIRAAVIDGEGNRSDTLTATYLVNLEQFRDRPVICLNTDPGNLFGPDGIYVTGARYDQWYLGSRSGDSPKGNFEITGIAGERKAEFTWIDEERTFSQSVGIRIQGASSRYNTSNKRFSVYARKAYSGSSVLDEALFEGETHTMVIRPGTANAFCQYFARGRSVAAQEPRLIYLFLDGELWYDPDRQQERGARGHSVLMEKYDGRYFQNHYGMDPEDLVVIKGREISEGKDEDLALQTAVYDFLEIHDLSREADYEAFCELVDIQSYIDFYCINLFIDNLDFNEQKNIVWWRSRTEGEGYADGRWRFGLYDMDYLDWYDAEYFGVSWAWEKNSFTVDSRTNGGPIDQQPIFASLSQNAAFRQQFALSFLDLVNTNFTESQVEAFQKVFGTELDVYYQNFFRERPAYILPYLAEEFDFTGELEPLTLQIRGQGSVLVNTVLISDEEWTGQYFTDLPVTLTPIPAEGWHFAGWEGVDADGAVTLNPEPGGTSCTAVFLP